MSNKKILLICITIFVLAIIGGISAAYWVAMIIFRAALYFAML
jgi:hypothetical protein